MQYFRPKPAGILLQKNVMFMKQTYTSMLIICLWVLGQYTQAQTPSFSGHVVSTFVPTQFGPISVLPDGSYFNNEGKKGTDNSTVWGYQATGTVNFVASDGQGGCVAAFTASGNFICQGDTLKPYRSENILRDVVIVHFNANGQKTWWYRISDYSTTFTTTFMAEENRGLKVVNGKVFWLVHFNNTNWTRRFNGQDLPRVGYALIRFSLNGNVDWLHHQPEITGNNNYYPEFLKMDVNANGEIALLGHGGVGWRINLGNGVSHNWASDEVRVVKFNANGVPQWAARCDRNITSNLIAGFLSLDDQGNTYICHRSSNMTGRPFNIPNSTYFFAKINADSTLGYARIFRNGALDGVCAINGQVYITGTTNANRFLQSGANDSIPLSPPVTFNANTSARFFARYSADGTLNWHTVGKPVFSINSTDLGTQQFTRLANGKIVLAASFGKNVQFGTFTWETSDFTGWINGFLFIDVDGSVGVNERITSQKHFQVYPNPTFGKITLQSQESDTFTLFTSDGRIQQRLRISPGANPIWLNTPKGIYFLRSEASGYSEKLIIE
jgi:hypothetical protein